MDRFKAITEKTQQVLALAEKIYGVKINPSISFNLRGRVAGWAGCKMCMFTRQASQFTLRYNSELINGKHFEDIRDETVPHEVAHLVCYARPELGRRHDMGWKLVCLALGGNGKARHDYDVVVKGRWDYLTDRGNKVSVTKRHHTYVQMGGTLSFKRGLGVISKTSPCAPSGELKITTKPDNTLVVHTQPKTEVTTAPKAPKVTTTAPKAPKVNTSVSKTVEVTKTGELTWAEKVRRLIRAQKALGVSMDTVIGLAITDLGMTKERAKSCVKAHWNKV